MSEGRMSGRVLVAVFLSLLLVVGAIGAIASRVLFAGKRPDHATLQKLAGQQAQAKQQLLMEMHQKRLAAAGVDASVQDAAVPIRQAGKAGGPEHL